MGIVYEAVQMSLGRRVALKVLRDSAALDPRRLRRFQVEAQAAASLRAPSHRARFRHRVGGWDRVLCDAIHRVP